jgi:hypothetical protein
MILTKKKAAQVDQRPRIVAAQASRAQLGLPLPHRETPSTSRLLVSRTAAPPAAAPPPSHLRAPVVVVAASPCSRPICSRHAISFSRTPTLVALRRRRFPPALRRRRGNVPLFQFRRAGGAGSKVVSVLKRSRLQVA